jgi:hypothetical protein
MPIARLNISESALHKVITSLKVFSSEKVEIIKEDKQFLIDKAYLHKELEEINNGNAEFVSHDELEISLDKIIAKHENSL